MKKLINGTVVEIPQDVIELFERASEGNITKKKLLNRIDIALEENVGHMGDIIEAYYRSYAMLPYPLYAVEDEIKYATIAANMQRIIKDKLGFLLEVEVLNNKLRVHSEEGYCLDIASENWAISEDNDRELDAKAITLGKYKGETLYRFFAWCDSELGKKKTTSGFYAYAVPGLLSACGNKPIIVKWEMAKLLQFAELPEPLKLKDRHIINIETGTDFIMDCFWAGEIDNSKVENIMVVDCRPGATGGYKTETRSKKKYTFDVYENNKENGRIRLKSSKSTFEPIFKAITYRDIDSIDTVKYKGIINDGFVAVQVEDRIYTGKLGDELSETGIGVELIGMRNKRAYIRKAVKKNNGAVREAIYIYDIEKDVLKVCDIHYEREAGAND